MRNTVLVICALALVAGLLLLPTAEGLSPQGQVLLAVTGGMLILWVTQAVDFSASSFYLIGLMALLCGLADDPTQPGQALGAIKGVKLAMQGFATPAWILVCCALFLAATVDSSGLGKRLSLRLLSLAGTEPRRIVLATLLLTLLLSLIIPSPAANSGLCTVLMLSVVRLLAIPLNSNLAKSIFLITAFGPALSTMMILTAGGGPVQTASFIYQGTGRDISWLEFAMYGAPMCLGCCAALYLLLARLFPLRNETLPEAGQSLREALAQCGPMSRREKSIAVILCITIPLWASAKVLHPVDTSTIAMLAVAAVFCPGVMDKGFAPAWKNLSDKVAWGTMMLFGAVLSLGQALLDSGAAAWLARSTLVRLGMTEWPLLAIIGAGGLLFAIFALAFSARSAAIGALTPTIIGFAQSLPPERQIPVWGLTLVLNYAVQFAILVPANSPMAMIAITSNSFSPRDMLRLSAPLMLAAFALMLLLACTWWPWLGL
ncbi:anion permease, partial [Desulfovibrio sp. OttesenSCG-928-A18]|nr:anion permease [Desulfovibrio sp. OttesenSCG-928-A18]